METRRSRVSSTYKERHHIVPRSEGGSDEPSNIVSLTAREHFLAHWLLYKADPSILARAHAFWRMCNGRGKVPIKDWTVIPSRAYEEARVAHSIAISKALKGRTKSAEHVAKIAEANRGQKRTAEAKRKMSIAKKGKPLTEEHKNNMKGRVPWNKGVPCTVEMKEIMRKALKGNNNAGKRCCIRGQHYNSVVLASKELGVSPASLKHRIRSKIEKNQNYYYL